MYPTRFYVCYFPVALLVVRAELGRQGHDGAAAAPLQAAPGV